MTPGARVQAAIEVLDQILSGTAVEQALTRWARRSRYAGSKDRAAVRDHVFDAERCLRSFQALGGARTGRGVMLGGLRHAGIDPDTLFLGTPYTPAPLGDDERSAGREPDPGAEALDIADWVWPQFVDSLGAQATATAQALQVRAPVHLRVNTTRATVDDARSSLARDGVATIAHPAAATALEITDGARRLRQSHAYVSGEVELQDAASQAVVQALPLHDGMRVLDYCAGGGGKALAMAARARIELFAHDIDPNRMRDLPARAARAGVGVTQVQTDDLAAGGPYDLILCDAPCSGSGAWRRSPEGKWTLDEAKLKSLCATQVQILDSASKLVGDQGVLAYATCSVLKVENSDQIDRFVQDHDGWRSDFQKAWAVQDGTDGFFTAHLTRDDVGI